MVAVLDSVFREIGRDIAAHAPERGGALLGPIGRPLVTRFLFDPDAETTAASYHPSRNLNRWVKEVEIAENLELKGIVHSHPGGLDRPSGQDEYELRVGLELNPHLATYLLPIVTRARPARRDDHERPIGSGKISFFAGSRTRGDQIRLRTVPVREIPVERDLRGIAAALGGAEPPEVFLTTIDGAELIGGRVVLDGDLELLLLASELYPAVAPLLLLTPDGAATEQVQLAWSLEVPAEDRLCQAVQAVLTGPGPLRPAYGPLRGPVLTRDPARARRAGWSTRYTGDDPDAAAAGLRDALFARSAGLLSQDIRARRVAVFGAGSVGSALAEELCRSGVDSFTLVDVESVEPANLCRTTYDLTDVGQPKVEALGRRLLNINPLVELDPQQRDILDFSPAELDALVRDAVLVIAATDAPRAQQAIDRFAYARGKPGLFVGLYAGARGGEVIVTVPERTPCYVCATAVRHAAAASSEPVTRQVDYGSGRLQGEVALGADIHHVTSAAAKLGLALLLPADGPAPLRTLVEGAVDGRLTYLTLSMVPDYWFYPQVFAGVPGQYAYQGVWLTPEGRPECPVCGDLPGRRDPLQSPLRSPRIGRLAITPEMLAADATGQPEDGIHECPATEVDVRPVETAGR